MSERPTREQDKAAVGEWIRRERKRCKLSQAELGTRLGVSQAMIVYLEAGKYPGRAEGPDLDYSKFTDLCAIFETSPADASTAIEAIGAAIKSGELPIKKKRARKKKVAAKKP